MNVKKERAARQTAQTTTCRKLTYRKSPVLSRARAWERLGELLLALEVMSNSAEREACCAIIVTTLGHFYGVSESGVGR